MLQRQSDKFSDTTDVNPWQLWIIFFSTLLIFISLWMISIPLWHLVVSVLTLIILWTASPAPLKTLAFIFGVVLFLAIMQILFSPFMRELFLRSLNDGFFWADWQYLLFAVERLAWPLVIVSTFQSKLANPTVISNLTVLLTPLKWLGLRIAKLQVIIILALRFMPSLQREWKRFAHFQTYFTAKLPQKTLLQKLIFWQGVFKAMIAHTIQRAVSTGELLALRGLPRIQKIETNQIQFPSIMIWLSIGLTFLFIETRIALLWVGLTAWLGLVILAVKQESSA